MKRILYLFVLLLHAALLYWVAVDKEHDYRWYQFGLYSILISATVTASLSETGRSLLRRVRTHHTDIAVLVSLMFISVGLNYFLGNRYPFVALGDEVRDAGLDAMRIAQGFERQIFDLGNYSGYGRIIPVISSFFFYIFGNTVWTYRIPALIVSTLDILLMYLLLRALTRDKAVSALGALTLGVLPLHQFYTRTEVVDIFDSFWMTALLMCFYLVRKKRTASEYILLGLVGGIASTFHTASRIAALITIGVAAWFALYDVFMNRSRHKWKNYTLSMMAVALFFVVGFGPMAINTSRNQFFQSERVDGAMKSAPLVQNVTKVTGKYWDSLLVVGFKSTTSRFPGQPLLTPVLLFFFVVGIPGLLLYGMHSVTSLLVLLALVIPFTNSALTDWVNADHRLLTLLPVLTVIMSFGYLWFIRTVARNRLYYPVLICIFIYLAFVAVMFFHSKRADQTRTLPNFLAVHIIRTINERSDLKTAGQLCLIVSPNNHGAFSLMHQKEQFQYFLSPAVYSVVPDHTLPDNVAYIEENGCTEYKKFKRKVVIECSGTRRLECPEGYKSDFVIYAD